MSRPAAHSQYRVGASAHNETTHGATPTEARAAGQSARISPRPCHPRAASSLTRT
ncbi:hypothetical protein [Streptomyces sp. NPDC046161]|uniref:hypothetical protein n=1 Tax=Streptomyces sp. NPDC046161 TaxID=3155132 RepID=UPI0033F15CCD